MKERFPHKAVQIRGKLKDKSNNAGKNLSEFLFWLFGLKDFLPVNSSGLLKGLTDCMLENAYHSYRLDIWIHYYGGSFDISRKAMIKLKHFSSTPFSSINVVSCPWDNIKGVEISQEAKKMLVAFLIWMVACIFKIEVFQAKYLNKTPWTRQTFSQWTGRLFRKILLIEICLILVHQSMWCHYLKHPYSYSKICWFLSLSGLCRWKRLAIFLPEQRNSKWCGSWRTDYCSHVCLY